MALLIANLVLVASRGHAPESAVPRPAHSRPPIRTAGPRVILLDLPEVTRTPGLRDGWIIGLELRPDPAFHDARPWPEGMVIAPPDIGDRMEVWGRTTVAIRFGPNAPSAPDGIDRRLRDGVSGFVAGALRAAR